MGDPTTDFLAMMQLEPHGPDVWVGSGPRYPWGGLYGGQIVAQALRAAAHTVDPQFRVIQPVIGAFGRRRPSEAVTASSGDVDAPGVQSPSRWTTTLRVCGAERCSHT